MHNSCTGCVRMVVPAIAAKVSHVDLVFAADGTFGQPERRVMRGGCICGAVRFDAEPRRREASACHCETCRRWTGSAFVAVSIMPEAIRFEGAENIRTYRSSDWAERAWCDRCGTTLYYHLTAEGFGPRTYEMALGLFDEPDGFPLASEIYIDRKPNGFALAGEHPRLTKAEVEAGFGAEGAT